MTEVSTEWGSATLGALTQSTRPICYGVLKPGEHVQDGVPLVRIVDIKDDVLDLVKAHKISPKLDEEFRRSRLEGGEVLLSIQGTIGRVATTSDLHRGVNISRTIAVIKPDERLLIDFCAYWLRWKTSTSQFKVTGTTRDSLNIGELRMMECPLPQIAEQERIVEILEEQFSRLDSALASIQAVREKAAAFRRSILHSALSGELTGGPEDWTDCTFGQIAKIASNLVSPEGFASFPHLAPNHIEAQTGRLLELATVAEDGVTSPKHRFFAGQIVYSKIRPYLNKVVLVDFDGLCSADMYPIETLQDPKWLHYKMLSSEFVAAVCGSQNRTVLPKTNVRDLSAVRVVVPPLTGQRHIVEILDEQFSRLDNALDVTNQLEARVASERRSLLHAAFTGQLTAQWRETHV